MKKSLLVGFAVGFIAGTANVLNIIKDEERELNRSPLTKWKDHLVEKLDYLLFAYHRHGQQPEYRAYTYRPQNSYRPYAYRAPFGTGGYYNSRPAYDNNTGRCCGTCKYGVHSYDEHCRDCGADEYCNWEPEKDEEET